MAGVPLLTAVPVNSFSPPGTAEPDTEGHACYSWGCGVSGPVPWACALGIEHDLCQEFRPLIGKSLGVKGGSMGLKTLSSRKSRQWQGQVKVPVLVS